MQIDLALEISIFDRKNESISLKYAVRICKIRPDFFFDSRFRWPFWPKLRRLDTLDFRIEEWHGFFKFKMLSTTASSSRMIHELNGDTQRYSDVASHPTRSRRAARLPVVRLQSAGAGSGLETKRSALGAPTCWRVRTVYNSNSGSQSHCQIQNTKTGCLYVARSTCLFAAPDQEQSAWAGTLGSYAQGRALGASLRGARPQQHISWSRRFARYLCTHNKSDFSAREDRFICELHC